MGTHFWKVNTFSNKFIIAKIAGDQGFAEQEISLKKIFEQTITVAYLKKQLPEVYCRKRC